MLGRGEKRCQRGPGTAHDAPFRTARQNIALDIPQRWKLLKNHFLESIPQDRRIREGKFPSQKG